eukprot:NODE_1659_length_1099_cov_69.078095_g1356_i0.p1 GENE.NODE_1659_length_1099_cov_69.078095_g1356_i0~~NODE_1659_length_1099_cov_69.078095_g1356_i0.p1  ORF type:complete len:270 (-),score=47.66 NODE_1659_length_1099_cov_69.078095_g1356_i0:79-888(-)
MVPIRGLVARCSVIADTPPLQHPLPLPKLPLSGYQRPRDLYLKGFGRNQSRRLKTKICDITSETGSDKCFNGYGTVYSVLLPPYIRSTKFVRLLEFGVNQFGSLKLWLDIFPSNNVRVVGVDKVCKKNQLMQSNCAIYCGDQTNTTFLSYLTEREGPFDVIIDDASHRSPDQRLTMDVMFPTALKRGGLYVVEDVECNYYHGVLLYNRILCGGPRKPHTMIEVGKWIARNVAGVSSQRGMHPLSKLVESVMFTPSIVAFWRKGKKRHLP